MADTRNMQASRALRLVIALLLAGSFLAIGGEALARPAQHGRPGRPRSHAAELPAPVTDTVDPADPCPHAVIFRNQSAGTLRLRVGEELVRTLGKGVTAHLCTRAEHVRWQVLARAGWQLSGEADLRDVVQRDVLVTDPDASMRVANHSGEDQRLSLDGRDLGIVKGGETKLFGGVLPAAHKILARGTHSNSWRPLRFAAHVGQTVRVELGPDATVTDVYNTASEEVGLRIDGYDFGMIPAGSFVRVLGLCGGRHEAMLLGKEPGQITRRILRVARAGEVQRPSEPVTLRLVNATGELLEVPEGLRQYAVELPQDVTQTWKLPAAVTFGITLKGHDSGLPYHYDLHATDSGKRTWRITRPKATVRLANRTGQEVAVLLPGLNVAHLDAGQTVQVRMPAGRAKLTAHLTAEERQLQTGLFLKPGAFATWEIGARETAITVVNQQVEPLQVLLDGVQRAEVRAQGDLRLDVPPGRHHIEVRAPLSHTVAMATFKVRDGQLRKVYFNPPDGTLRIDNRGGDTPLVLVARGRQEALVPKGAAVAAGVAPGRLTAEVRDPLRETSEIWTGSVVPTQQVDLDRPPRKVVDLELENTAARAVRLTLDQGEPHDLAAGATWHVAEVQPGMHVLSVQTAGQLLRRRIEVDAHKALVRVKLRDLE